MSPVRRALALVPLVFCVSSTQAADIAAVKEVGTGTNGFRALVSDERPAAPLLAPASNEGQARIKQFKLMPGMKVDLWAAEPMLANPVAFSVDELGRVWTSETYRYRTSVLDIRHYMFMLEDDLASRSIDDRLKTIRKWFGPEGEKQLSKETEVIRLIEDTDHDSKADKSTVVADGLNSPLDGIASGILARHGQVWFTDIPSVWKFSPSPAGRDAKPSPLTPMSPLASRPNVHLDGYQAEELLRGWGVRFSFTGHDLHGLKFGPDGRLYFSVGDRGTHVVTKEGTVIDLPDEGAVFRCEPDGSQLEVFAHGLRNPQELAFDEYGNLFTGDNDSDQGDRERWEYVVEGGDYGWRVGYQHAPLGNAGPWNMERLWVPHFEGQAAYLIPPVANIGDGPSGLVHNYGTGLPASLDHRFLLADFKGTSAKSGIYSLLNRPSGAGFELVAHDQFVWNTLVPDVDIGPDGAVWFADWHEGWPKSNKGRLYRAYFPEALADPVVKETTKLLADGMEKRDEAELLALLAHRDMRVRQEAQFELAARGPKSFAGLKKVAFESKNQLARIHAIWGIGQIVRAVTFNQFADEMGGLLPLLWDEDPAIRSKAVRLLSAGKLENAIAVTWQLLDDSNPEVRYHALLALAEHFNPRTPPRIAKSSAQTLALRAASGSKVPQAVKDALSRYANTSGFPIDFTTIPRLLSGSPEDDVLIRHAAVQAMTRLTGSIGIAGKQSNQRARMAAVLAQRSLRHTGVATFLTDQDPLLVLEAARAINDVPITNALPELAALAEPAKLDALLKQFAALKLETRDSKLETSAIRDVRADQPLPWGDTPIDQLTPMLLRVVNANFRVGTPETARRLAALAARADLSDLVRTEALYALFHWIKPPARDRVVGIYRPLPERREDSANQAIRGLLAGLLDPVLTPERIVAATCGFLRDDLPLLEAEPHLEALVRNEKAAATLRAVALRPWFQVAALTATLSSQSDASEKFRRRAEQLIRYAAEQPHEGLRLEASKLNAELNPDDAAGQLAAKLTSGTLAEQQSAFTSLGDLKSDAADAILAEWLDKLMKREVANEVMLDLVEAAAKRTADAVRSRLAAYAKWKLPQDHLTPYREALSGGDAARGKKIFYENAAVACTRCHHIGTDGGGNAGPVLDGIASRQPREYLLESIVFPNQQIVEGFETAMISLKNGADYAGVVKSETATELTLLSPEDGDVKLKKSDIAKREKGLSGMPEGFGQLLTRQELRDVVEFLGTLK